MRARRANAAPLAIACLSWKKARFQRLPSLTQLNTGLLQFSFVSEPLFTIGRGHTRLVPPKGQAMSAEILQFLYYAGFAVLGWWLRHKGILGPRSTPNGGAAPALTGLGDQKVVIDLLKALLERLSQSPAGAPPATSARHAGPGTKDKAQGTTSGADE
jgi:hypothetical protein